MNRLAFAPEPEHPDYYRTDDDVLGDMIAQLMNQGELKVDKDLTLDIEQVLADALAKYERRHIDYLTRY
jgi:NTP pyrophosphatase (non-canonical NTP hydrolase)